MCCRIRQTGKGKDIELKSFKSQFYGKEGKFAIVAGAALLVAIVLPFTGAWYVGIATVSLSAICAIALALFRVRLWVRLITMPLVMLAAFILVMSACDMWLDGTSTSWGDPDYDAKYFGSQLLMKCPMFGRVTQTQEGQKAKADYERWGDRIDDLTILPWRSYEKRYRRIEVLPKIGAEFGFIAPVLIIFLHIGLAFWGTIVVVRLKRGVYRAVAGWVLAILVLPWIDVLIGPLFASSYAKPWFVLPDYLPFLNEQPELLLASLIQSCVLVAALRYGRNREAQSPSAFPGSSDGRGKSGEKPRNDRTNNKP